MAPPRRVGILGAGWGTRVSVPAFRAAGWEVVGLWSRRPERAESEAARLAIPFFTSDSAELITRPDVDAVAVHTPPGTHLELCRAAFAAGKHVLCDKPFAADATEARALHGEAERSGLVAMINYEFRFTPLRLQIAQLMGEGAIGQFQYATFEMHTTNPLVQLERLWRLDPAQGGGLLNELGSHAIDRTRQWFGEIASVTAQLASFPAAELDPGLVTEDVLSARMAIRSGGFATLTMSWVADPPPGLQATIVGSEGVLSARSSGSMLSTGEVWLGRSGETESTLLPRPPDESSFDTANSAVAASERLIRAFAQGIEEGVSPAPNFSDGLQSQIVIDAIRASAADGRTVELPA